MSDLLFCGDFGTWLRWEKANKSTSIFGELTSYIKTADFSMLNLETPATDLNKPSIKSGPNIKTNPEWLDSIKEVGFKLLGLANNHMGDWGPQGIIDCLENCHKKGIATVGAGQNLLESQKIFYFNNKNEKIAIIAVCENEHGIASTNKPGTAPLDIIDNIKQIETAKKYSDFVILNIHGGNELFPYPRPYLRKLCHFYIERGCDAIICHHPHVPGAYELYENKPIFYSLGNFIFDCPFKKIPTGWNEGYAVKLSLSKTSRNVSFEILPYTQSFEQNGIKLMQNNDKTVFLNKLEQYRNILSDNEKYNDIWEKFCYDKKHTYLLLNYLPKTFPGLRHILKVKFLNRLILGNKQKIAKRLNIIRCDSHRETLINILEKELLQGTNEC